MRIQPAIDTSRYCEKVEAALVLAWDFEIGAERSVVERLDTRQLALLGFRIIRDTVAAMQPPFASRCLGETVAFVENTLAKCRDALAGESRETIGTEEFYDKCSLLSDRESSIGACVLMALSEYVDSVPDGPDVDGVLDIMSACYEAVLNNAQLGRFVTPEMEMGNPECVAAIAMQRRVINEISVGGVIDI